MADHLSYSQVHTLGSCGWQYYLQRETDTPQRPSTPAVAGRVIHTASEAVDHKLFGLEQGHHPWDMSQQGELREELLALASSASEQSFGEELKEHLVNEKYPDVSDWRSYGRSTKEKPNAEDIYWFRDVGIPAANEAYVDWRLANPNLQIYVLPDGSPAIEVEFNIQIGERAVRGYIDRVFIDRTNKSPLIVDLKSGGKPDTDEQLGVYRYALEATYGLPFVWGAYLYALKKGGVLTAPISLEHWTEEQLVYKYGVANKMIQQKLFLPNPGPGCFHCGVSDSCLFNAANI